jgi:glycosyltransferase involved in cell wall biosynthesis
VDAEKTHPRITVVTPSFNQGHFLEETIQSVLSQKYPNLEYMIIDGGSSDNSAEIIKKYEKYLAYWVSEKDDGQTDAVVKGFRRSTGVFLTWLNSDDTQLPGCLFSVAESIRENPDVDVIYGDYWITDLRGKVLLKKKEIEFDPDILLYGVNFIGQPAAFFSRAAYDRVGGLNTKLNYYMDLEFWLRVARENGKFKHVKKFLATYRFHPASKTILEHSVTERCMREAENILHRYWDKHTFERKTFHSFYYGYLRTKNRLRRQYRKLLHQHTVDFIPGRYFVWYIKNVRFHFRGHYGENT